MAKSGDLKDRAWKFALRCIKLCKSLPNTYEGEGDVKWNMGYVRKKKPLIIYITG